MIVRFMKKIPDITLYPGLIMQQLSPQPHKTDGNQSGKQPASMMHRKGITSDIEELIDGQITRWPGIPGRIHEGGD